VPSGGSALQPSGGLAELGGLSWAATTLSEHVSTYRQTLGAQLDQLHAEGCTRLYRETASGKLVETGGR
jgi:hypothetical protein